MLKQTKANGRNYVHKEIPCLGNAIVGQSLLSCKIQKKNFIDVDFRAAKGREPEEGKKITTFKTFKLVGQIISGL